MVDILLVYCSHCVMFVSFSAVCSFISSSMILVSRGTVGAAMCWRGSVECWNMYALGSFYGAGGVERKPEHVLIVGSCPGGGVGACV